MERPKARTIGLDTRIRMPRYKWSNLHHRKQSPSSLPFIFLRQLVTRHESFPSLSFCSHCAREIKRSMNRWRSASQERNLISIDPSRKVGIARRATDTSSVNMDRIDIRSLLKKDELKMVAECRRIDRD